MDKREQLIEKQLQKAGRAGAINAKCIECIYDPDALGHGSWRKQVENCTATKCPLYKYRPCTVGSNGDEDEE